MLDPAQSDQTQLYLTYHDDLGFGFGNSQYDLTHQDLTQCPSVTKPRAEEWQLHRQVISRSHKAHNAYNNWRRGWDQTSYLSHISQIISVEKILSCGEISDFCKEFEQFMAFHKKLYRFCSKFVWRNICVEKITSMRSGSESGGNLAR